ncbi:phosphatidate cytidylyltransferase [Pseudoduganella lurida]|nr:phosphatidate cytidylyltransferase [Pseudoduganella lurida]
MTALYGLLGLTSLLVQRLARPTGTLRSQVNAWWRIFPFVTIALLLYPLGPLMLGCLIYALAVSELMPHAGMPAWRMTTHAMLLAASVAVLEWQLPATATFLVPLSIAAAFCYFQQFAGRTPLIHLLLLLTASVGWILARFSTLSFGTDGNLAWLFYLFIVTALNDIGQFVAGKLFGNRRIAPTISPNKTWQGLAGGLVVSQLVTLILGTYLQLGDAGTLALYAVLLSLGGFAGDLLFSAAKRYLGIKDFSQLIPGHGGILDRVDSLVVTAPLLYCLLLNHH